MLDKELITTLMDELEDLRGRTDFPSKWRGEYLEGILMKEMYERLYIQRAIKRLQGKQ